jgi:hypothetical protein
LAGRIEASDETLRLDGEEDTLYEESAALPKD